METGRLIPHLFRTEYSKITAVLCRRFGIERLEIAEDLASETFLAALNTWPYRGIPENPTAWLYTVAKNKTKNYLAREQIFSQKVINAITDPSESVTPLIDLSDTNITDSQLRMLFAICVSGIPPESQIGLALRILCGFGIDEIAKAFLTSRETITKRLFRAKEKLRSQHTRLEFPSDGELGNRLKSVLTTLYLLFSEGYYSETHHRILREELCEEAMRLVHLLTQHPATDRPEVNALLALMCFHASRFRARIDQSGFPVLYDDQDQTLWDETLIAKGVTYLHKASVGTNVSKYHLEAGIAYWHTMKPNTKEKWESILALYDYLLAMEYSPIAALNRTFAMSKIKGVRPAIEEAEKLQLPENPFYFALLGELYTEIDHARGKEYYVKAQQLARTMADQRLLERKLQKIDRAHS